MCVAAIPAAWSAMGTMAKIATAASIASGAMSAYGQYQDSRMQAAALNQQAKLDAETANLQEKQAHEALEQGKEESDRRRRAGAIQRGEQVAALAANGVDVEGGLALDLLDDSDMIVGQDAFAIREQSRIAADGYAQQARNSRIRSNNATVQARSVKRKGTFGAIGTILTTAAMAGQRFNHFSGGVGGAKGQPMNTLPQSYGGSWGHRTSSVRFDDRIY